jgi:hypothetical protein
MAMHRFTPTIHYTAAEWEVNLARGIATLVSPQTRCSGLR